MGQGPGARRREFYEDRDARSSILARSMAAKPDTLKQTDDLAHSIKPLADGAGHTFLMLGLPGDTWLRLVVWLVIGLAIYFLYGRNHSHLARRQKGAEFRL
jgi:hypothetical protein